MDNFDPKYGNGTANICTFFEKDMSDSEWEENLYHSYAVA